MSNVPDEEPLDSQISLRDRRVYIMSNVIAISGILVCLVCLSVTLLVAYPLLFVY